MFLKFTEVKSQDTVAINVNQIVAVFTATEGEISGKTVINLLGGMIAVEEDLVTVLGQLSAV